MQESQAQPKCPSCGAQGIEKIVSQASTERSTMPAPWFFVAYCSDCGHVYGVFAKHVVTYAGELPALAPQI